MARFALALIVFCAACGGNPAGPAGPISAKTATIMSIRIVPDTTTLRVGATEQFSLNETMSPGVSVSVLGKTDVRVLEVVP